MTVTLASTAPALPLKPGRWRLDKAHFRVGFAIRHLGVSKVRGHFTDVEAELRVGDTLTDTSLSATIGLASIDSGNADRNAHMRAPEWLDTANRTSMTFTSTGIHGDGFTYEVDGDLTIGDVTRPVQLSAEFGGIADFFDGTRHAGFHATTRIRRRAFALDFGQFDRFVGDVVEIEIDLELLEP